MKTRARERQHVKGGHTSPPAGDKDQDKQTSSASRLQTSRAVCTEGGQAHGNLTSGTAALTSGTPPVTGIGTQTRAMASITPSPVKTATVSEAANFAHSACVTDLVLASPLPGIATNNTQYQPLGLGAVGVPERRSPSSSSQNNNTTQSVSISSSSSSSFSHTPSSSSSPSAATAAQALNVHHVPDMAAYLGPQDRQTSSPVQLTELVCCSAAPSSSAGCDKNHNLPSAYVTSPSQQQSLLPHHCPAAPDQSGFVEPPHRLNPSFPDSSTVVATGHADFSSSAGFSYYHHDLNEGGLGLKAEGPSSSHFPAGSSLSCPPVYPKDGLSFSTPYKDGQYLSQSKDSTPYKDSHYLPYSFDSQVCRAFSFCSVDAGREYSPPEVSPYTTTTGSSTNSSNNSSINSTCYTSPLANSLMTAGSPDSVVPWSPNNNSGHAVLSPSLSLSLCLPKHVVLSGPPTLQEKKTDNSSRGEERGSDPQPSAGRATTRYSGDKGVEEDSMQDIKQDILTSDIHKHIYENFAKHIPLSPMDDDDDDDDSEDNDDHAENTPVSCGRRGGGHGKGQSGGGSSSGKKRRRRTQTPVQRKAANLRERKRMCYLNRAFNSLKDRLPNVRNRKKLSRIQTLKAAIFYIGLLSECLQTS